MRSIHTQHYLSLGICVYIFMCVYLCRDKQTERHIKRAKVSKEFKKSC